jgi:hypothetical protein
MDRKTSREQEQEILQAVVNNDFYSEMRRRTLRGAIS